MDTATTTAVPKTYIAKWIELDFFNNSNLKIDIQNRISVNIETEFINALNDMRGDNKNGYGVSFSEITRLALAYFYTEVFNDKIKDSYYTVEMVKGFLDANNLTTYTAIHEIDVPFYKLNDAPLFKHCWLIIQSAWFFNSQYFGQHQHIDYLNHYITTGRKLPIDNYNFDLNYLEKKYNDIDTATTKKIPVNGFLLVSQWYYSILFLVCNELKLSTKYFNVEMKGDRETNPLPQTSRQLRPLTPFKVIECDIKSAWATFLDIETGANLKDHIYNNLMLSKGITRNEAKVLFNTVCNSGAYKTKAETTAFFLECGYTQKQCEHLITLTHDPEKKFYYSMTEYERLAIQHFTDMNNLQRGTRLHDAILFIDDKTKPAILTVHPNCDFGYKELNRPIIKNSFSVGSKRLPYAYINSIPKGFNLITKHEAINPPVKGIANGFVFYVGSYRYISANFNLNSYHELIDKDPQQHFLLQCKTMLSTLHYLNKRNIKPLELEIILKHIREYSNYIFNVKALYVTLIKYNQSNELVTIKQRDYNNITFQNFAKNIDYLNALNNARMLVNGDVNYNNLFALIQERVINNDYGFLNESMITGKRKNNVLIYSVINKFNLLVTGRVRCERHGLKKDPLYNNSIKRVLFKSLSLKPQQQNAFIKKGIAKYERELKELNTVVNNRTKAQQLLYLLRDVGGFDAEVTIIKNGAIVEQLKAELITTINRRVYDTIKQGAKDFDLLYKKKRTKAIKPITDQSNIFDTDLKNSIFNNISIEDAYHKGDKFFKEFEEFNGIVEVKNAPEPKKKTKAGYKFPEINFDV
ncbi:MAG: hypothetical protein H7Y10_03370 [Flavobacterium sp.]|nr:hypothetical protein [Flavobacterium sp.]